MRAPFLFLALSISTVVQANPAVDQADVIWTSPSSGAAGSMPIGNGELVANVWVEDKTGDLLILPARTDALSETCRFLKLSRLRIHIDGNPFAGAKDFKQHLRLRDGVIHLTAGTHHVQVFADSGADVLHITGASAGPVTVAATIECWRDKEMEITDNSSWTTHGAPFRRTESADVFVPEEKSVCWYHRNESSVVPKLLETQSLVGAPGAFDPLLHRTFGGMLGGPGFIKSAPDQRSLRLATASKSWNLQLATHGAQADSPAAWLRDVRAEYAMSADPEQAIARTRSWWHTFWDRSWVAVRATNVLPANAHPLRLGVDSAGGNTFAGKISDAAIHPIAMPHADLAKLHGTTRAGVPAPATLALPASSSGITMTAWIHPTSSADGRLFDKITAGGSDGFLFDTHPGNGLRFIVGSTILQAPACLKPGDWQHVAASWDATTGAMAIFHNGVMIASRPGQSDAITRGYTLQRYAMGFQGRGTYPIKFNGGFFCVETNDSTPDWRKWGDCYWWQNTRLMYHPMLASGDSDLMAPLFNLYAAAVPLGESRSAKYHGVQGVYFPETMTVFGTYGGDYQWDRRGKQPADVGCPWWDKAWNQGPELVALMLDYWDHTGDRDFVSRRLVPMAESVLKYFDTRFKKDAQGKILIDPTQSVETYWHGVINDAPSAVGLINITRRLCALPEDLVPAGQRAFFARMRAAAPALPVETEAGRRELAPAATYQPKRSNCENPELYAVFPYREVSLARPALRAEAVSAFTHRGSRNPVGWGYDSNVAALLGLTDEAASMLATKCANSNPDHRWPATWGPNFDWLPDQNHGGNLMATTQLMLLQADDDKILLLPAWPKHWDADFKLHAPGNTVVTCRYTAGKLAELVVEPASRRKDVILPDGLTP